MQPSMVKALLALGCANFVLVLLGLWKLIEMIIGVF